MLLIKKKNSILRNACYRGIQKLDKWFPKFDANKWKSTYRNTFFGIILDPRFRNKRFASWGLTNAEIRIVIEEFKVEFERYIFFFIHFLKLNILIYQNRTKSEIAIENPISQSNESRPDLYEDTSSEDEIFVDSNIVPNIVVERSEFEKYFDENLSHSKISTLYIIYFNFSINYLYIINQTTRFLERSG